MPTQIKSVSSPLKGAKVTSDSRTSLFSPAKVWRKVVLSSPKSLPVHVHEQKRGYVACTSNACESNVLLHLSCQTLRLALTLVSGRVNSAKSIAARWTPANR